MIINVAALLRQPVGARADYRIAESPIDPRGENAGLLDTAVTIEADVRATHTNPGAYLEGDASADIDVTCSRCLKPIRAPVRATFAEQYYATIAVVSGEEVPEAPMDSKTIGSDFRIDLTPLIREELILATPFAPLCRADCRGLCPVCGDDLNERPHAHDDAADERWAKLLALRDFQPEKE